MCIAWGLVAVTVTLNRRSCELGALQGPLAGAQSLRLPTLALFAAKALGWRMAYWGPAGAWDRASEDDAAVLGSDGSVGCRADSKLGGPARTTTHDSDAGSEAAAPQGQPDPRADSEIRDASANATDATVTPCMVWSTRVRAQRLLRLLHGGRRRRRGDEPSAPWSRHMDVIGGLRARS